MSTIRRLGLLAGVAWATPGLAEESAISSYQKTASKIIASAMADDDGWRKLEHLTTVIGHRLSGSSSLEQAIAWAEAGMRSEGLDNVRKLPVAVPHWVRGEDARD